MRKSRNTSAGLFRARCDEIARRKRVNSRRQLDVNKLSEGSKGEYHHLGVSVSHRNDQCRAAILDIVSDYCVSQTGQSCSGAWLKAGEVRLT